MRKKLFGLGWMLFASIMLVSCNTVVNQTEVTTSEGTTTQEGSSNLEPSDSKITVRGELNKLSKEEGNWKSLTTEQKLEDFDSLYQTLKDNYPYMELLKRKEGVDLEEQYQKYREKVKTTKTDMQFFVLVSNFVSEGGGTGHMDLIMPGFYQWMVEGYQDTEGIPKEELPRMKKIYDAYSNKNSAETYGKIKPIYNDTMERVEKYYEEKGKDQEEPEENQGNPATKLLKDRVETENLEYGTIEEGKIAYIRIKGLDMGYYNEDKKTLKELYKKYRKYNHVIFDFTDNGGGGMGYFNDLILAPNIDQKLSVETYVLIKDGDYNRKFMDLSEYQPIGQMPSLPRMNQDDLTQLDLFEPSIFEVEPSGKGKALKGKLWMLVNENVYSSSEYGAMFTKASGFATLVGETTGGDGIGVDPLPIVMENSGLIVRYAPIYGVTYDGAGSQEFGTEPDIKSPKGESEIETCLKEIKKQS